MIFYWIQIAFVLKSWNYGKMSMIFANFCLFSFLILRWNESGHFPLSNLYESLIFLSWSLSTFHLFLENILEKMNTGVPRQNFLGAITSPAALFTNAFAAFSLPTEMQRSSALVPALQSNWLMMHVTVMILSYSALICGSLLSIAFLIFTRNIDMDNNNVEEKTKILENIPNFATQNSLASSGQTAFSIVDNSSVTLDNFGTEQKQQLNSFNLSVKSFTPAKKEFLENLDNLSYRILGIGFPFLTIGILSGAVWANEAWGSYWSWDPKETWALATWLVFAIYLHTRLTKDWRGKKPAIIASFGFVIVWVCFLGVNLLGEGLHSYGFFKERF